jgi:O-Antigen ligase
MSVESNSMNLVPRKDLQTTVDQRATFTDKIHATVVAGYLGISGIFWFPHLSHAAIAQAKVVIVAGLAVVGLLRLQRTVPGQAQIYMGLGLCAIAASISNVANNDILAAIHRAPDFVEPMLWLIALFGVRQRAHPWFFGILTITMTMFFVLALYPVGAAIGVLPNLYAPSAFADPTGMSSGDWWMAESNSVVQAGFTGSRTGWGVSLATSALLTTALYMRTRLAAATKIIVALVIIGGSVASIVVTGARGGSMALIAVSVYGAVTARGLRLSRLALVVSIIILAGAMDAASLLPKSFSRNFDAKGDVFTRVNTVTTGRFESYKTAFKYIASSPITGVGSSPTAKEAITGRAMPTSGIHNIWLRVFAESGLILFIPMLFLSYRLLRLGLTRPKTGTPKGRHGGMEWPEARLVIVCGLILALAEPSVIIGAFNSNVVFWTAVWMTLSRPRSQNSLPVRAEQREFAVA